MARPKKDVKAEVVKEFIVRSEPNRELHRESKKHEKKEADYTLAEHISKELIYKAPGTSLFQDIFNGHNNDQQSELQIIEPYYNPDVLRQVPLQNNILNQCIDAMVQNIEGTGFTLEYVGPPEYADEPEKNKDAEAEKKKIENFLSAPNEQYSFEELRRRLRRDREIFGYCFIEVLRDVKNEILAIYHCPANNTRATTVYSVPVELSLELQRGDTIVKLDRKKYYRRYVQAKDAFSTKIYFKEFGDLRPMDDVTAKTGEASVDNLATEILMLTDYKPGTIYGWPRWINQSLSIMGSYEAELVNLTYFKSGAKPDKALLVSGGSVSTDSVKAISNKVNDVQGLHKRNDILILEAFGDLQSASPEGQLPVPKVELLDLRDNQNDGLFQEYDTNCADKVRSSFRIPSIYTGDSQDINYAAANASIIVAESQVFGPERKAFDEVINKNILGDGVNPPKYWAMKSNPSKVVNKEDIVKSISVLESSGALTTNAAIGLANSLFDLKLKLSEQPWADYPYSMVLGLIAQKQKIEGLDDLVEEFNTGVAQVTNDPTKTTEDKKVVSSLKKMFDKLGGAQ